MNFFERIRKGRLFYSADKIPEQVIKFIFKDKSYILEEFNICFYQELNAKGRPDGLPKGGIIDLTFAGAPDESINEWMSYTYLRCDGEIRFLSGERKVTGGAELIIFFENAYCVGYEKHIHTLKGGLYTTLKISPHTVRIGNEEFTNKWKKEEDLPYYIRSGKT